MDTTTYIRIESVIAPNFELVWKDAIKSLGQSKRCYGYMTAYESVVQKIDLRDLFSQGGLLISFFWICGAMKTFLEFSQGPDLPSRLVNDIGRASWVTVFAVMSMLFLRTCYALIRVSTGFAAFSSYFIHVDSNPFIDMPHIACLPAAGKFSSFLSSESY